MNGYVLDVHLFWGGTQGRFRKSLRKVLHGRRAARQSYLREMDIRILERAFELMNREMSEKGLVLQVESLHHLSSDAYWDFEDRRTLEGDKEDENTI